jgi:hypothetical protein
MINCNTTLAPIDLSCSDTSIGGIDRLMVGLRDNLFYTENTDGSVYSVHGVFYNIAIVENTGASSFQENQSISSGVRVSTPTVTAEVLTMTADVREAIDILAQPYINLVALVRATSGEWFLVGKEFGLSMSAEGRSGAQRSDKAGYILTLTGEENNLSDVLDESQVDAFVVLDEEGNSIAPDGEAYMTRLIELSKTEYVNIGSFSATMENLKNAIL